MAEDPSQIPVTAECGGVTVRILRKNLEEDDGQDANFFDADYSVAGATGFTVWDGAWAMIEQIRSSEMGNRILGKKVIELGSGTGLAGLCAAAHGAHIMLTDIASVTNDMLIPNIALNTSESIEKTKAKTWPNSVPIGVNGGSAAAAVLDWNKGIDTVKESTDGLDFVIASEVVWLKELVEPFVKTMYSLLCLPSRPICLVVCRERAKENSQTFAHVSEILDALKALDCTVSLISSQTGPDREPTSTFQVHANH